MLKTKNAQIKENPNKHYSNVMLSPGIKPDNPEERPVHYVLPLKLTETEKRASTNFNRH